jgi:hypothetical protein
MALNVLVVDDSSVMRAMIIRSLRLSGLELNEIHQAVRGEEGRFHLSLALAGYEANGEPV